jgi:hypothetical protein
LAAGEPIPFRYPLQVILTLLVLVPGCSFLLYLLTARLRKRFRPGQKTVAAYTVTDDNDGPTNAPGDNEGASRELDGVPHMRLASPHGSGPNASPSHGRGSPAELPGRVAAGSAGSAGAGKEGSSIVELTSIPPDTSFPAPRRPSSAERAAAIAAAAARQNAPDAPSSLSVEIPSLARRSSHSLLLTASTADAAALIAAAGPPIPAIPPAIPAFDAPLSGAASDAPEVPPIPAFSAAAPLVPVVPLSAGAGLAVSAGGTASHASTPRRLPPMRLPGGPSNASAAEPGAGTGAGAEGGIGLAADAP